MKQALALRIAAAVLVCSIHVGCTDATQVQLLEIPGSGSVAGQAFLDLDFSGTPTSGDEAITGVSIEVVGASSSTVVASAVTDTAGVFEIDSIPVGDYLVRFAGGVVGDTLEAVGADTTITVLTGDTVATTVGATYTTLTLAEALAAPAGRMIFTSGIALNQRVPFDSTGRVHISEGDNSLRALAVERSGISVGDSVRFLGRTVIDTGRPALIDVRAFVLVTSAAVVSPVDVSTAEASTARDTALDAALVRVRGTEISDTTTTPDGNFRFWMNDGSDSVEVVVRDFLGVDPTAIRPDTTVRVAALTGLLSPVAAGGGELRWQLLPRSAGDIQLETKFANVGLSMTVDTTAASLGDTLTFTVVVTNSGPLPATGVTVIDSIPTQTSFSSATQTRGSYDDVSGLWSIGDLAVGAADTLQLRVEITDGSPVQIQNVASTGRLVLEVDPDGSNNGAIVFITIS
jgi:uncharacterized repeat protein (TIGR01451 family)